MATVQELQAKLDAVQPVLDTLKSMFGTSQDADFTITCGDRKWPMNKAIVCAQSPVIEAAMRGDFKEAKDGIYSCKDKEPSVVEAMLHFMYHFDYSEEGSVNGQESIPPIVFDVQVHMAADYYQVPSLAKLAVSKFEKRAQEEWASESFAQAAALIYAEAGDKDHQLRDTVVSVALNHSDKLIKEESGAHLRKAADEVPALGSALWQAGGSESSSKLCKCPNVHCTWMVPLKCVDDYIHSNLLYCVLCSRHYPASTWKATMVQ
ncbi:hypothetical protein LTR10_002371 [Elasticomyces elasticus]|nr:hypothetical protein LTR10_002371 [Elasticomyces elasticus]KAK4973561.1 hypothetical protein LTR42_005550 [Elasticomyces elasticus]